MERSLVSSRLLRVVRRCAIALLAGALTVGADAEEREHPGHGSKVVLGTLKEVTPEGIVVEVLDSGSGGLARVHIDLEAETRFRIDKERITSIDGMIGERAIVSVEWEDEVSGGQRLTATEVRFRRKK